MKKAWLLVFISCIQSVSTYSQNRNSVWCFGDSAGIDFRNVSIPVPISTSLDSRGSCVSISDSLGNLLFYGNTRANGSIAQTGIIYNRNHDIMQNGDSIAGEGWYHELLIIPFPNDLNKYYLFSLDITSIHDFHYSIIDMKADNGLGAVTSKNILIKNDSLCDAMTAVKHGNGRDWWVIIKNWSDDTDLTFYEYLITPDTIKERVIEAGSNSNTNAGTLCFSKDGNKLAFVSFRGLIEIFDFDRCTGEFSNVKIVHPQWTLNYAEYSGASFSPNGNLLYISDGNEVSRLFQFDLTASNVWAARDTLATITTSRYAGGNLKLAPDNKIYWTCTYYIGGAFPYPYADSVYHTENMNLSVINDPDVQGQGCNFSLFSFNLGGKRTYWGLPNNPDYELGALWGSVCDSLTNGVHELNNEEENFNVFPNPAKNILYIAQSNNELIKSINIFNTIGQKQKVEYLLYKNRDYEAVNTSSLQHGIYFLEIQTDKQKIVKRFIKE